MYRPAGSGRRVSGRSLPFQLMIAIAQEYAERLALPDGHALNVRGRSHLGSDDRSRNQATFKPQQYRGIQPALRPRATRRKGPETSGPFTFVVWELRRRFRSPLGSTHSVAGTWLSSLGGGTLEPLLVNAAFRCRILHGFAQLDVARGSRRPGARQVASARKRYPNPKAGGAEAFSGPVRPALSRTDSASGQMPRFACPSRRQRPPQFLGAPWQIHPLIAAISALGRLVPAFGICEPLQRSCPRSLETR